MHFFKDTENQNVRLMAGGKVPTYRAHAYSGGKLFVEGFDHPVVLDLKTIENGDVENYLRHDETLKAGSGSIEVYPTHVEAAGSLNVEGTARDEIINEFKAGKRWEVSIGAAGFEPNLVPDGERVKVNGRTQVGPFYLARGGRINEISFVDRGGDVENHVSLAAAKRKTKEVEEMNAILKEYAIQCGLDPDKMGEGEVKILEASFNAQTPKKVEETKAAETVPADLEAEKKRLEAAAKEQRKAINDQAVKVAEITRICAAYGHPNHTIKVDGKDREVSLVAHALENDWDTTQVELQAKLWKLENAEQQLQASGGGNRFAGINMADAKTNEVLAAAICLKSGENDEEAVAKTFNAAHRDEIMNRATEQLFREMSVHGICDLSLRAMSKEYQGLGRGPDYAQHVINSHRDHLQAAGVSTVSLNNVLENVMNKNLLMAFNRTPATWRQVAHTYAANDYKPQSFYRLTAERGFLEIGDNGQIEHAGLKDSKTTAAVSDYGMLLVFTSRMIVNDDMGALSSIGSMLGSMAGRAIDEKMYEMLLTWSELQSAALVNTPLSYGALIAIDEHFDGLVDSDSKPIDVPWDTLIVPNAYKRLANKLANEPNMAGIAQDASAPADVKENAFGSNEFAGRFMAVHSKWITPDAANKNSRGKKLSTPTGSNQKYFALTGPSSGTTYQPIRVGFLNGNQTPRVSSGSVSFDVEGIGYKALYDFGVDKGDIEGIKEIRSGA